MYSCHVTIRTGLQNNGRRWPGLVVIHYLGAWVCVCVWCLPGEHPATKHQWFRNGLRRTTTSLRCCLGHQILQLSVPLSFCGSNRVHTVSLKVRNVFGDQHSIRQVVIMLCLISFTIERVKKRVGLIENICKKSLNMSFKNAPHRAIFSVSDMTLLLMWLIP